MVKNSTCVNFNLDNDMNNWLIENSQDNGLNKSEYIRLIIDTYRKAKELKNKKGV